MERLIDKLIVGVCCCVTLFFATPSVEMLVGGLIAITLTSLYEAFRGRLRVCFLFPLAFVALACLVPGVAAFLPIAAYDCLREKSWPPRVLWPVALPFAYRYWTLQALAVICLVCVVACLLSWRTGSLEHERDEYRAMRDGVREESLALEAKMRDLQETGDLQVRLAMLSERSRIAREIHDNVGHLLTRAIMQVEALQVEHADEPRVRSDFSEVGATLHVAMDEVRSSVHGLREESLDVREQIEEALRGCGIERVTLDYQTRDMPVNVGYCFIAVVREALSNVARHSDATRVDVTMLEHPGLFQLSIDDNGSCDPGQTIRAGRGMGLSSMEDRVRALGGTFRVGYDNGFHVFAAIPRVSHSMEGEDPS